jgi:hypothetical protein
VNERVIQGNIVPLPPKGTHEVHVSVELV